MIDVIIGFLLLLFLMAVTLLAMYEYGIKDRNPYLVFPIALAIHLVAVLFIYYTGFGFGGGADFTGYHQNAVDLSYRFKQGNISLDGLGFINYFPVLIAVIYTLTLPEVIIGNLFTVWLAALSVVLVYKMVLEIGGTAKSAFLASLITLLYPSYLYFGSVLLKDTVVIPLVLISMLLAIRMLKSFSWFALLMFFIALTALIHLRFYVGYAVMLAFILSWPILSQYPVRQRMKHWLVLVLILGASPLVLGSGYYGSHHFKKFLNFEKITYFREVVYTANSPLNSQPTVPSTSPASSTPSPQPSIIEPPAPKPESQKSPLAGSSSTFVLETGLDNGPVAFLKNSLQSFTYSLLGPFPWQFHNQRQLVGLAETLPWYLLIIAFLYHAIRHIKKGGISGFLKSYKFGLPLFLFSILALGALSLFINNYGIIARIRIPMLICLIPLMSITFSPALEKQYEKISHYWR